MTVLVLALFFIVPDRAGVYLIDTLFERGGHVTREIAGKVSFTPEGDELKAGHATVDELVRHERDVRSVWVLACAGACTRESVIAQSQGSSDQELALVIAELNRGAREQMELPGGELLSVHKTQVKGASGYVVAGLDRSRIDEAKGALRRTLFIVALVAAGLIVIIFTLLSRLLVISPLKAMRQMALHLSEADLSRRVAGAPTRELDELADSLNSIGQGLRDTLGRVRGVAESVAQVIDQISRTASTTTGGASTVLTRVEETSSAMVQMLSSLKGIAENVEVLWQSAEDSSSSIMEMLTTNDEVAANVTRMAASVEETTSAIEQTTYSIKEVARNVEDLLKNTETTSSSIREMDVAIGQVETNAYETARLSEQVSRDAETGMESIQKTIAGIDRIRDSSQTAADVIEQLARRIGEIGNIVDVIDDVAEQTNLLALNAAIIAAQAGEHGKGFAVVADEIKDLSERTAASTREIADLIRSVQTESRNAASAMTTGVRSVEEGVLLGREAEGALKKIQESAKHSTQMVKAIARATVEQARGSKDVTAAVERVRDTIEQINKATTEQARGSEQVMKAAEQMKLLTTHVKRSVDEQSHGGKQISRSIENINEMVGHLNRAQKEQTRGTEQVLKAIETIRQVSDTQNRSVKQLEEAIETLRNQADVLRGEVRRFRV